MVHELLLFVTIILIQITFGFSFDDSNTQNLRRATSNNIEVAAGLNFDPNSIDWKDYMMNTHIPGLVKYALK